MFLLLPFRKQNPNRQDNTSIKTKFYYTKDQCNSKKKKKKKKNQSLAMQEQQTHNKQTTKDIKTKTLWKGEVKEKN